MNMRLELADELVREVDAVAGPHGRSGFVRHAVEVALEREHRWSALRSAASSIADGSHDWDADPSQWVREQRRGGGRRAG